MQSVKKTYLWLVIRLLATFGVFGTLTLMFMHLSSKGSTIWLCLYIAALSLSGIHSLYLAFKRKSLQTLVKLETVENRLEPLHLLASPIIFVYSFCLVCFQINTIDQTYFVITRSTYYLTDYPEFAWIIFGFDNVIRAVFLDVFETYKITISNIDYVDHFLIETLIFIFKVTVAVFFWRVVIGLFGEWKKTLHTR